MNVLFRNEAFVAVDKPAGWLSVPSRWGSRDERRCVGRELEAEVGKRLWPVHRLDEEVTGVLLFALTAEAHGIANGWFEERRVSKTYEAWTEPSREGAAAPAEQVTWESKLARGKKRAYESEHGKPARTLARSVGEVTVDGRAAVAWELEPVTGRPHQLRFELWRHGWPILGDALYGSTLPFVTGAIALRCVRLAFRAEAQLAWLGLPANLEAPSLAAWHASDFSSSLSEE